MELKKLMLAAVAGGLLTGCATNAKVKDVQNEAEQARTVADLALEEARLARQTALDTSNRAQRTEEMVNRGFRRSMYK